MSGEAGLAKAPFDPPTAQDAAKAQDTGKVYLKSDPAGANIFLGVKDGNAVIPKDTGKKTPSLVEMPVGKQTVLLSLEGYDNVVVNVVAIQGVIAKPETAVLAKSARPVDVMFAEDGWAVLVDGKPLLDAVGKPATTPCTVRMGIGKHDVSLAKDGFKDIPVQGEITDKTGSVEVKGKIEEGAGCQGCPQDSSCR